MKRCFFLLIISMIFSALNAQIDTSRSHYGGKYKSFGEYDMEGKTFYIESGNLAVSSNDLEFKQYADYITQTIKWKHAIPTTDKKNADVCVLLDYGITNTSYVALRSIPVWGQTGISSITTETQSSGNLYSNANAYSFGNQVSVNEIANGSSVSESTSKIDYNYGISGYRNVSKNVKRYTRFINLYAYDNKQREGEPIMLWKVNGTSEGSSDDLTKVFPHMAGHLLTFIGANSDGFREIGSYSDDLFVENIKHKVFLADNMYLNPKYTSFNDKSIVEIISINSLENETILMICSLKKQIIFSSQTYLLCNGKKVALKSVDNVKMDAYIRGPLMSYYYLHFPIRLSKGEKFDVISYKDQKEKNIRWGWHNIEF